MLPDIYGTDVCRQLRARGETSEVAVLMLTARSDEPDRLLGFEVGADDYVIKPFSVREVMMRVRALCRRNSERAPAPTASPIYQWGGLEVICSEQRVFADGRAIKLRPLEYRLLSIFLEKPGRLLSRNDLLQDVWGLPPSQSRTVDVHVRRLRVKLGSYGHAIETVHGVGYRLRDREP
jgi:two-component system phosphate regulon response regulator PhoB